VIRHLRKGVGSRGGEHKPACGVDTLYVSGMF
jgi:hypothetical protein